MAQEDDKSEFEKEVNPEIREFMENVKSALEKLVGDEGMVAIWADVDNGIFCISMSLRALPPSLVTSSCAAMMANALHNGIATSFVEQQMAQVGKMPERIQ